MTEQNPDSNPKEQDDEKWVEGQSTVALKEELRTLELRRIILQNKDPEIAAQMSQQGGEDWAEEWITSYNAEMAAATTAEEEERIRTKYEGDKIDVETAKLILEQLDKEDEERGLLQAGIVPAGLGAPPWLAERLEVNLQIDAVRRELTARRIQELLKGETASALVGAQRPFKLNPRRNIVQANRDERIQGMLLALDENHIELPPGPDWYHYRKHKQPWTDAYRLGGKKLQGRILSIISKAKKNKKP